MRMCQALLGIDDAENKLDSHPILERKSETHYYDNKYYY